MDIASTIGVDQDLEKERNDAMVNATLALVNSFARNGDVTPSTEQKCTSAYILNATHPNTCAYTLLLTVN